ncbi:hypothetical protein RB195_018282 [Necator americanus]|uniref:Protein root UVB sensitive/RUS domain-containing protein n=1 Tax=Necator americanus TaxID=51031 RepID=A0ABR1CAJ3_NECAM
MKRFAQHQTDSTTIEGRTHLLSCDQGKELLQLSAKELWSADLFFICEAQARTYQRRVPTTFGISKCMKCSRKAMLTVGSISLCLSSIQASFINVFLPQGYPYSVSEDYLRYQLWDTMQAFASSMTAALATEAVLKGAGVGNQSASALAASLTWIAKDGLGMIGRITFSFFKGSELDYDCKKWRLVADIMNDVAFFVDLLSPALPGLFFVCACTSSLLRCVVGVAGAATRTAIVQHQARRNNLADVSSKDGSQETMVNMTALLASLIMLPLVSGKHTLIWSLFVMAVRLLQRRQMGDGAKRRILPCLFGVLAPEGAKMS